MSELRLDVSKIFAECEEKVLQKMQRASISFPRAGTDILQAQYNRFSKKPIDTGESLENSTVTSQVDFSAKTLTITLRISTPYSPYFRFGLGSSRKYGNRDPIKLAIPIFKTNIIQLIRNS